MVRQILPGALNFPGLPGIPAQARDKGVAAAGPGRAVTEEAGAGRGAGGGRGGGGGRGADGGGGGRGAGGGGGGGGRGGDVDAGVGRGRLARGESGRAAWLGAQ